MAGTAWTPATEALLTRLWTEEGRTFAQIAEAVSAIAGRTVTRSAVSGRVTRLGLSGKGARDRSFAAPGGDYPPLQQGGGRAAADMGMPITEQDQAVSAPSPHTEREGDEHLLITPAPPPTPEPGTWRLAERGPSQCRYACTPHAARPEAHRFCGQPTRVGPGNLRGSWCPEHLPLVWSGAKTAGGASRADVERERGVA